MTPEHRNHLISICDAISRECENDVNAMDGKELTGVNVAQWFAETLAMVSATADLVKAILHERGKEHEHGR